jgi:NADH:ubiquinone oxidoreductase subunit K
MLSETLHVYLIVGALLFAAGVYGIVQKRSFIGMLIAIELMLSGAGLNCMAFNRFTAPDPATGQLLALFIMGIAAAEAALSVSFILAVYKRFRTMDPSKIFILKR